MENAPSRMHRTFVINFCFKGFVILCFAWQAAALNAFGQCLTVPISLEDRVMASSQVALCTVVSTHAYWDEEQQNIYTLYILDVSAWLKGNDGSTRIGVIGMGGVVDDQAQITYPSVKLSFEGEYILCMKGDNTGIDNKAIRHQLPGMKQVQLVAGPQGAIMKQFGYYREGYFPMQTEAEIFQRIESATGEPPTTPYGIPFEPRPTDPSGGPEMMPVTNFSPDPTHAGTIDASDFITISGSGFGASQGTVWYANANDGGSTYVTSGVATDVVSWSDTQVISKPAGDAGTGQFYVEDTATNAFYSLGGLTIDWAHIEINSDFASFPSTTRQRYFLVDPDGSGGYVFEYSTNFISNTAAVDAYDTALCTWRNDVGVNFTSTAVASGLTSIANDDVNLVVFNSSLPNGVLGRMTSRFSGAATGSCNQTNTVWYLNEMDCEFNTNPGGAGSGFSWNYGPGATTSSEYDFTSVAIHEIGHGAGMGHIISNGSVMHYALANGTDLRSLTATEIAGAANKLAYSTNAANYCFYPSAINGPMVSNTSCGGSLLPVTWLSFSGTSLDRTTNLLRWEVANEVDAKSYIIQRMTERSRRFEDIGSTAAMEEHGSIAYEFTDPNTSGKAYYRIKQVDYSGAFVYSEVIALNSDVRLPTTARFSTASQSLHVQPAEAGLTYNVQVFDAMGRMIIREDHLSGPQSIFVRGRSAGIYFYRVFGAHGMLKQGQFYLY